MKTNDSLLTDAMRADREVALALLKPSGRDLEYGLALHRESFVAESYSLGLQAPADPEALNQAAKEGASPSECKDLLEEQILLNWTSTAELRDEYERAWRASGVSCTFVNAGEESNNPLRVLKRLARYTRLTDTLPDLLSRGTSAAKIHANHRDGKRTIGFALNGIPLPGRNESARDELREIRVFAQLGARMMHLTYQRRNLMGDGCGEPHDGGLSDFGHAAVAEMNRLGVIIDLAHTGWQTCLDAARATKRPLLVSHSAVHALNAHIRAKPDEVIRAVLDTGGTMGITNVPAFLGGSGGICAFLDHLDYMIRTFGNDSVTIGTDAPYMLAGHMQRLKEVKAPLFRPSWEKLWPVPRPGSSPEWNKPEQLQSLSWTNWPLFTVGMVQRGFRDETIRKILGLNLLRVVEANES